jgi:hypothetical protein
VVAGLGVAASALVVVALFATGPLVSGRSGLPVRASSVIDAVAWGCGAAILLLASSPRARRVALALAASRATWFLAFALAAFVLSLGPVASAGPDAVMREAPYGWLYAGVPGYDGLRVPARYAMLVVLGLSMVGAFGVRAVLRAAGRPALVAAGLALVVAVEGGASPLPLDRGETADGLAMPPVLLPNAADPPPVYAYVRRLPADAVVAEFPFGTAMWELRYMYASTLHWRRLVNGYSGGVPHSYAARAAALGDVFRDPDAAWTWLRAAGTTHVIVHEAVFPPGRGTAVTGWLRARGARPLARFGDDLVLALPGAGLE